MRVCFERSSAFSMGDVILSTVRKAARLAVYDEMMMRVKNHHRPLTIRVEIALGITSQPGDDIETYGFISHRQIVQEVDDQAAMEVWM